jgi:hypothetical protein
VSEVDELIAAHRAEAARDESEQFVRAWRDDPLTEAEVGWSN